MEVVIDLDDVICDLCTPFHKALMDYTSRNIPVCDWHDFNLAKIYGISKEEVFNVLKEYRVAEKAKAHRGSIEALEKIKRLGFTTHIVTSRNGIDPTGEITKHWLAKNDVAYEHLHITCHLKGKSDVVKDINPILMVDDHSDNIESCSPYSFELVLINQPWNKSFDESCLGNVIRKDSLFEAISLL